MTLWHMTLWHITLCHMTLLHMTLWHMTLWHMTLLHITLWHYDICHYDICHYDIWYYDIMTLWHMTLWRMTLWHYDIWHMTLWHMKLWNMKYHLIYISCFRTWPPPVILTHCSYTKMPNLSRTIIHTWPKASDIMVMLMMKTIFRPIWAYCGHQFGMLFAQSGLKTVEYLRSLIEKKSDCLYHF